MRDFYEFPAPTDAPALESEEHLKLLATHLMAWKSNVNIATPGQPTDAVCLPLAQRALMIRFNGAVIPLPTPLFADVEGRFTRFAREVQLQNPGLREKFKQFAPLCKLGRVCLDG